ncbi:hypothetical protein IMZ48_06665 [Candidatus Bathyarchaeota archaeon]|nr:hypothetical protein [Candidatus Bathyarchaeota archaeon]
MAPQDEDDALTQSSLATSTIEEVPSDVDTLLGQRYPRPIINPGPLQGSKVAQFCKQQSPGPSDSPTTDPFTAVAAAATIVDGPGRRGATSPTDSAFGADPPRPPQEGLEWVWHPRGYWAERDVDEPAPACFGICG